MGVAGGHEHGRLVHQFVTQVTLLKTRYFKAMLVFVLNVVDVVHVLHSCCARAWLVRMCIHVGEQSDCGSGTISSEAYGLAEGRKTSRFVESSGIFRRGFSDEVWEPTPTQW